MSGPSNLLFWSIIIEFNNLMKDAITGPDCTDPSLCKGDCCSIKIDVPKILARKYIEKGFANKDDFTRSNIYSFQLRFNDDTGKCFLFDKQKNGCKVHFTEIKPPQCWIYPTNFTSQDNNIACKKLSGWKIEKPELALKAQELLNYYNFLCSLEARKEKVKISKRLKNSIKNQESGLHHALRNTSPSSIGGFKDGWDSFTILPAEGISLQMKKFCLLYHHNCQYLPDQFLECKSICETITLKLIEFILIEIPNYVKHFGAETDGDYPLFKIFKKLRIFKETK